MKKKLTPKQKRFVQEYLIDLNATQAAIRSGYSPRTARKQASRLLTNVDIQEAISAAKQARNKRLEADSDYVLQRLLGIDQMDIVDILNDNGTLKAVKDWPLIWRQYISFMDVSEVFEGSGDERDSIGMLKKIRWPDKLKNLELLGKHVNIQAFKEKKDIDFGLPTVIVHDPSVRNEG